MAGPEGVAGTAGVRVGPRSVGRRALALASCVALAGCERAAEPSAEGPATISSTATVACRGCSLTIDSITTLGDNERKEDYFATSAISAAVVNDRLMVASTVPVQMYDLAGRFIGSLGRKGRGPGEIPSWTQGLAVGPDRSLYVFVPQQALVFDSALRFERTITLARSSTRPTVLTDGKFAGISRMPPRRENVRVAEPLGFVHAAPLFHLFDANGSYLRSVGDSLSWADLFIASGADGTIWTGKRAPYQLKQWTQEGTLITVIDRETPFFDRAPFAGPYPYAVGDSKRPSWLIAFRADAQGLLWTAARVPRPDWRPTMITEQTLAECCDSVIEVLDPRTGALLGSGSVPLHVQDFLNGGHFIGVTEGEQGEPLVVLYRAKLTVPQEG